MTMHAVILRDLARRYPDGFKSYTTGGKRLESGTAVYPCPTGWRVNVDGEWHTYDRDGALVSIGLGRGGKRKPKEAPS